MKSDRVIESAIRAAQNLLWQNLPPTHKFPDAAAVARLRDLVRSPAVKTVLLHSNDTFLAFVLRAPGGGRTKNTPNSSGQSRPRSPRRQLKPGTVLVRDYQDQRHTVTVALDGFDWQGTTYASLSAIAHAITGTAWSGPRFFALAQRNGAPAHGPNKKRSMRAGRNGSHPATRSSDASLPLQTASPA